MTRPINSAKAVRQPGIAFATISRCEGIACSLNSDAHRVASTFCGVSGLDSVKQRGR